jgi:hypothetical protein
MLAGDDNRIGSARFFARGRGRTWATLLLASAWLGVGCASQLVCETPSGACVNTGGPTEAAVTALAAGTLWAAGGGCAIAGCRYPLQCNQGSGLCEHLRCGEHRDCPVSTSCDQSTYTCR